MSTPSEIEKHLEVLKDLSQAGNVLFISESGESCTTSSFDNYRASLTFFIGVGGELDEILLSSQRAIEDAIYLEDGLDGAAGEAVLDMIDDYRKKVGLEIYKHPVD